MKTKYAWSDVRSLNEEAGHCFFSRETMRFFRSSTLGSVSTVTHEKGEVLIFVVKNVFVNHNNKHIPCFKICLMTTVGEWRGWVEYLAERDNKDDALWLKGLCRKHLKGEDQSSWNPEEIAHILGRARTGSEQDVKEIARLLGVHVS